MHNVETLQTGDAVVGSIVYKEDRSLLSLVLNDELYVKVICLNTFNTKFSAFFSKQHARKNIDDILHRLFVCICSVADQLQSNYSSDIRKILKMVLQPVEVSPVYEVCNTRRTFCATADAF